VMMSLIRLIGSDDDGDDDNDDDDDVFIYHE
jgi:hypothetical protein